MGKCKNCEGWGFVRDPSSPDGWKRGPDGNGILCPPPERGGCGGSGAINAEPELAAQP